MCILPQSRYRRIPSQILPFENLLVDNFIIHILYLYPIPSCSPLDTSQNISYPHSRAAFFLLSPTERNVSSLMECCCLAVLTVLVLFMGATAHYMQTSISQHLPTSSVSCILSTPSFSMLRKTWGCSHNLQPFDQSSLSSLAPGYHSCFLWQECFNSQAVVVHL